MKIAVISAAALALLMQSPARAASPADAAIGIPGPRTCFWARGPFSGDPYINLAFPDANTFYWSATFTVPEGAKLRIEGSFPHSRYMSFISYDAAGRPIEALADYLIAPQPGSTNPFRPGADRTAAKRHYAIDVIDAPASGALAEGIEVADAERQVLSAPRSGSGQQTILYRIYANDSDAPVTGGMALPEPVLTMADGKVLRGAPACAALNASQQLQLNAGALGIPVAQYRELTSQPGKPDTWPAQPDPRWHIQLDRANLLGIYTGQFTPAARRSEGGFYPNPDNNYIRTILNLRFGPVAILRAKAPTTPRTIKGDRIMGQGQLRYWSVCSNQGFANTRVNDCVFDEEIPTDAQGYYTIIISKAKDRPRNARPECGLQWLPVADDGDGIFDPDVALLVIRHMLSRPDFKQAIQHIPTDDKIAEVMGDYAPKMRYVTPNVVEGLFPCQLDQ